MILLVMFLFSSAVSVYFWSLNKKHGSYSDWEIGATLMTLVSVGFLIALLVANGVCYTQQLQDKANITKFQKIEKIYTVRADKLTTQFKALLAVKYPKYEKSIFDKIGTKRADVNAYLVVYPQLRTSDTFMTLVSQIRSLQDSRYAQEKNIADAQARIKVKRQNPWLLFMP